MIAWMPPLVIDILQGSCDPISPNECRRKDRNSLKIQSSKPITLNLDVSIIAYLASCEQGESITTQILLHI